MSTEWQRAKVLKMIDREINRQLWSRHPSDGFGSGLIEAAYAIDLITTTEYDDLNESMRKAIRRPQEQFFVGAAMAREVGV